jgi:hypothetical protein
MKKMKVLIAAFAVMMFGAFMLVPVGAANALDPSNPIADVCKTDPTNSVCKSQGDSANALITKLVNILLFVIGALSTIMIIVGGIFYVTSSGDSSKITRAKNTIMYAVVGLVIALVAYAIVNWVIALFIK